MAFGENSFLLAVWKYPQLSHEESHNEEGELDGILGLCNNCK